MSRHPYTHACDYIRSLAGYGPGGAKLSRSDASQIRQGIAKAIGMDDAKLADALSVYYQQNDEAIVDTAVESLFATNGLLPRSEGKTS